MSISSSAPTEGVLVLVVSAPTPPRRLRTALTRLAGAPRAPRLPALDPQRADGLTRDGLAVGLEAPVTAWCVRWPPGPLRADQRRVLRWAEALGAPGSQGRVAVALVWPTASADAPTEAAEASTAATGLQGAAQTQAEQLLVRVVAANRHGVFVTDGARAAWPAAFTAFGCHGWRRAVARPWPGRLRAAWVGGGLAVLGLLGGWASMWLSGAPPGRPAEARTGGAALWLGLDGDDGRRGSRRSFDPGGPWVRTGEVLRVMVSAEPDRYGSVVLFDSTGRWSLPDPQLVDLRFDAARPVRAGHLMVDGSAGREALFLVTGPRPMGPPRALEQALNAPALQSLVPPILRALGSEAHLRATLHHLLSPQFVVAARFALEHRP